MSLNGSGVFNVNSAGQPVVAGTLNTAAAFNAYTADVAAALSTALYKDGQQLNAANQNMGGYKLTNLAAGSVAGDSLRYEQLPEGRNLTGGLNGLLSTVASHATTADIFATTVGNLIDWTGTATTTDFTAAPQAGAERTLVCDAAAVFTAGANMLIDGLVSGQSFTAEAGDKIIVRAVTPTQFRLTPQRYAPPAGTVLQVVAFTDVGASTSAASMTSITNTTKNITPKSNNSTLIIEVDFKAQILAGGAGTNTLGYFQLYDSTAAANIGVINVIGASSGAGANLQTNASGRCSAVVANAALTTIGFLLRAMYGATACQVYGTAHVWKITEVQN